VVHFLAQFFAGAECGDGDCDDDTAGDRTQSTDCGFHGGPGGETVIDENDDAIVEVDRGTAVAISGFAALDLKALAGHDRVDGFLTNAVRGDHIVLEHDNAATGHRTHRQFFLTGNAEFAYDEDIEREMELAGNFKSYGNSAARQSEDDCTTSGEFVGALIDDNLRQSAAGVAAILKDDDHDNPLLALFASRDGRAMVWWNLCRWCAYSETAIRLPSRPSL
jgi:hypothetical protein